MRWTRPRTPNWVVENKVALYLERGTCLTLLKLYPMGRFDRKDALDRVQMCKEQKLGDRVFLVTTWNYTRGFKLR